MRQKPNILFILIDDLGQRDLSCYGSTFYETPRIDSLARDGMRFSDAYAACPVCSPTRASLLTGRYPATIGVTNYIDASNHHHPSVGKLIDVPYFKELPRTECTISRVLHDAGYVTWHVGKWHLGGAASYPEKHGFDVNIGGCEMGHPHAGYFSPFRIPNLEESTEEGVYLTDYLTDKAVELIEDNAQTDTPFFLNMWYYSVHTPIQAKADRIERYRLKAQRMGIDQVEPFQIGSYFPTEEKQNERIVRRVVQSDPAYAAMIDSLDENVGRLLDAIARSGQAENTIVVFTSDNGGLATAEGAPTSNYPLSEGKGWMYEGGTREPLLVRWPSVVSPGSESSAVVTSPDFFPTLLSAVEVDHPAYVKLDGCDFSSALRGEAYTRPLPAFWHYPHYGNQGGTPGASIRHGNWKLIEFYEDDHQELFDLETDPGEMINRVNTDPSIATELSGALHQWQAETHALRPTRNPDFVSWADRQQSGRFSPVEVDAGPGWHGRLRGIVAHVTPQEDCANLEEPHDE